MVFRKKRSHFMKLYLWIKDRIYLHMYFQYKNYWDWLFIFFCINFIVWDIFDNWKLQLAFEHKIYIWKRFLIDNYVFLSDDILINISKKHKTLFNFYFEFKFYSLKNINLILFCQVFHKIYLFKQILLINSINEYSWSLDIFYTIAC